MKKLISMFLCLLLIAAPLQALASEGDVVVGRVENGPMQDGISTFCASGDALYMLFNDQNKNLGVHRVGEAEMTLYPIEIGEPVNSENSYAQCQLLADGEKVYVLRRITDYSSGTESTRAELYEIALDGDIAIATLVCEPDWSVFLSDDASYYNYVESMVSVGGYVMMHTYDDYGNSVCYRMSLEDGSFELCALEGAMSMTVYTEDRVLAQQYTDEQCNRVRFVCYDPETDACQTLGEVDIEQYEPFYGVACDLETGKVYYTRGGELFELNVETGETGEAVTDMPITVYYDSSPSVLSGGYYVFAAYDAYVMRNLNPTQKPSERLKIYDGSYMDSVNSAYYTFVNEHSDASVILSREYTAQETLIDDMMNRASDVDIYILSAAVPQFEAVFNRGYIADFSGNEALQAVAERMDPTLREQLSVDGQLCALPVEFYFWIPYLNEKALNKLGMTVEDVPTNWSDFLDFLIDLQDRMPEDGSVALMEPWTSDTYARQAMFEQIFSSYQQLLNKDPNAFTTDQMVALLEKLEQVDFTALGQPTDEETMSDTYNPEYNDEGYLLYLNMGTSIGGITNQHPMVMSLTADTPALLSVSATVAFVNPFSSNRELALKFMEKLAEKQPDEVNYVMFPDLTEPVENPYYEEGLKSYQEYVDNLRARLEEAEEVDRQDIELELSYAEKALDNYDQYRYTISEQDIAWIRANAENLAIMGSNWLYNNDDEGEAYELVQQYCQGQIDAQRLMDEIGRKIRMMMMEGY